MQTTTTSGNFSVNWRDAINGLVYATILPVLTIIQTSLAEGSLTFDWKKIGIAAGIGFVGHIIRKFFSTPVIVVDASKETVQAVKDKEAQVIIKQ